MDLHTELAFPADPGTVFAMLTDPKFLALVAERTGAITHDVRLTPTADGVEVRLARTLPANDLPDFVRSFTGPTLDVVQVDTWGLAGADGTRRGSYEVQIPKAPGQMRGTMVLAPAPSGGSVESFEGTVKISVPFIGGRIEKSAGDAVLHGIATMGTVGREWLAG